MISIPFFPSRLYSSHFFSIMSWVDSSPGMQAGKTPVNGHDPEEDRPEYPKPPEKRKRIVVVGLGMVGIAFM